MGSAPCGSSQARRLVLLPEDEGDWLDPDDHETALFAAPFDPYPAEELEAYPVSSDVNRVENTGEELIVPPAGA